MPPSSGGVGLWTKAPCKISTSPSRLISASFRTGTLKRFGWRLTWSCAVKVPSISQKNQINVAGAGRSADVARFGDAVAISIPLAKVVS